jgi:competence protein ComEA
MSSSASWIAFPRIWVVNCERRSRTSEPWRRADSPMATAPSDDDDDGKAGTPSFEPTLLPDQRLALIAILCVLSAVLSIDALMNTFASVPRVPVERLPERRLDFRLDINEATWAELIQLPGIGPQLANRIIESRQSAGPFAGLEDLGRVAGLGPNTRAEIAPFLAWPARANSAPKPTATSQKGQQSPIGPNAP